MVTQKILKIRFYKNCTVHRKHILCLIFHSNKNLNFSKYQILWDFWKSQNVDPSNYHLWKMWYRKKDMNVNNRSIILMRKSVHGKIINS